MSGDRPPARAVRGRLSTRVEQRIWRQWDSGDDSVLFSVEQAARLTQVNPGTLRSRIASGSLPASTNDRGHLRIAAGEIRRLLASGAPRQSLTGEVRK